MIHLQQLETKLEVLFYCVVYNQLQQPVVTSSCQVKSFILLRQVLM